MSLLFCKFINTTTYHLGSYEPSSTVSCQAPHRVPQTYRCKVLVVHTRPIFIYFRSSKTTFLPKQTVNLRQIQTRILGLEGDHLTLFTANFENI